MLPHSSARELLDDHAYRNLDELSDNLRDMSRYNGWLCTYRLSLHLATRSLASSTAAPLTGLDVGVGSADSIAYARRHATTPIEWTGLDLSCDVLRVAQEICSAPLLCASGLHLPFADGRFDVVTCAHVLHHLEPAQVSSLLHECARVARRRLVVLDLARNYIALTGAWLLTRATSRNRMTLADGVQSVRRAYTPEEAAALAEQAGLAGAKITARNPFRYALVWSRSG